MAIHSSTLAWGIPWTEEPGGLQFSSGTQSCLTLCDPWTVAHQAPLSMGFPRQEYLSGLPFPSPGDLPHPGTEPASPKSPALADGFFTTEPPGKPLPQFTLNLFE